MGSSPVFRLYMAYIEEYPCECFAEEDRHICCIVRLCDGKIDISKEEAEKALRRYKETGISPWEEE